jgi:putative membrane protein
VNILTLGLFTFVVNGAVLKICSGLLEDFEIKGWWSAIFGALVLALISSLFHWILI